MFFEENIKKISLLGNDWNLTIKNKFIKFKVSYNASVI